MLLLLYDGSFTSTDRYLFTHKFYLLMSLYCSEGFNLSLINMDKMIIVGIIARREMCFKFLDSSEDISVR